MPNHSGIAPSKSGIILVGERGNYGTGRVSYLRFKTLISLGAFNQGPARSRLESLGLEWQISLNLLPPMPLALATWKKDDQEEARDNAKEILILAEETGSRIVVCGQRAAESFGIKYSPLSIHQIGNVILFVLPHPSGRNRWWNTHTEEAISFVRESVMKRENQYEQVRSI